MLEGYVDQSETAGYMASEVYYKAMSSKQEENIKQLQEKYSSLISAFDEAVKNGSIEKYSDDWFEMYNQINDVELELQDATTQLIEFNQTLQQLSWDVFDRIQGYVSNITAESERFINILDSYNLHTDKGVITNEGLAVQGLHAVNYNTYMEQSLAYAEEMRKIEEEMAKDPYDLELIDRRNELIELQQEAISNAIKEKESIHSLWKDGYDKMLDSLDKLISKRKEAMRSIKDLYDYEQSISEKTNTVASLNKQLESYKNDTSESGRALIQKITVERDKALKDLEQTEWEKQIEESEKLLDAFYSDTEEFVNNRLDNLDGLVAESIDATNKNADTISKTIKETASAYGSELSDQMETIWNSANSVVSVYGDIFHSDMLNISTNIASAINGGTTNVIDTIKGLGVEMQAMTTEINRLAIANANSIASAQNTVASGQSSSLNKNTSNPTVNTQSTPTTSNKANNTADNGKNDEPSKPSEDRTIYLIKDKYFDRNLYSGTKSMCEAWISNNGYKKMSTSGTTIYVSNRRYEIWDKNKKTVQKGLTYDEALKIVQSNSDKGYTMKAYASGTDNAKRGVGLVGEAGSEIIVDKDGNILLAKSASLFPFSGGETVINAKETEDVLRNNLMPLSAEQLWGNIVKTPSLPNVNSGVGGNVTNYNQFSFDLPNVVDADSLITELQHSKRFEKILDSMTAEKMLGKNSLGKFRF